MKRSVTYGVILAGALGWLAWAQDAKDPVQVESVKLTVDPAACMGGQTKMAVKLDVKMSGEDKTGRWRIPLTANCQFSYHKEIHLRGEDNEPLAVCHVHSNMCTGYTGSGVMDATCKGGEGEPAADRQNFSCPRSKEGTPGA